MRGSRSLSICTGWLLLAACGGGTADMPIVQIYEAAEHLTLPKVGGSGRQNPNGDGSGSGSDADRSSTTIPASSTCEDYNCQGSYTPYPGTGVGASTLANLQVQLQATYYNPVTNTARPLANYWPGEAFIDAQLMPSPPSMPAWQAWDSLDAISVGTTDANGQALLTFAVTPDPSLVGILPTQGPTFASANPSFNTGDSSYQAVHANYAPRVMLLSGPNGEIDRSYLVTTVSAGSWTLQAVFLDPNAYDLTKPAVSCSQASDCTLIDTKSDLTAPCLGDGADQSSSDWIAASKSWYTTARNWGSTLVYQGAPGERYVCPQIASDPRHQAVCQNQVCTKP